jgi:hypothetical protein
VHRGIGGFLWSKNLTLMRPENMPEKKEEKKK